jgi:DNA repair protein RadC
MHPLFPDEDTTWSASNPQVRKQEVQALVRLLRVLMKPPSDERITRPADMAALLMLEMGHLDHEEFWQVCLDTKNHVQRIHPPVQGKLELVDRAGRRTVPAAFAAQ